MTNFLKGTVTALVTPFEERGVNFDSFGAILDAQIKGGVFGVVVLGTTGEPAAVSDVERERLIKFAVSRANGRIKVLAGAGSNDPEKAVKYSKIAETCGADGLLVVTPYYNRCTQDGLTRYYETVCRASALPVVCYNVPARTGVNLLPETAARIAEFETVAGIKEASGNMAQIMETARLIRGKCDLYSGEDALNLPILAAGGSAAISVLSNLAPEKVCALVNAALQGNFALANRLNDELLPLEKACFSEVNPIPVKAGMNLLGFAAGTPRPPLTPLPAEKLRLLRAAMRACGLLQETGGPL